jgi:hypothetical protein
MTCPCNKAARRRYPNNPAVAEVLSRPLVATDTGGTAAHFRLEESLLFHLLPVGDRELLKQQHAFIEAAQSRGEWDVAAKAIKAHEQDEGAIYDRYIMAGARGGHK